MARSGLVVLAVVVCCVLAAAPRVVEGALTCEQVVSDIASCATYLINGGTVSTECCNGVTSLNSAATTAVDRQAVCNCTKQTMTTIPGINYDNVRGLPGKCGVDIDFDINADTDCSKVN